MTDHVIHVSRYLPDLNTVTEIIAIMALVTVWPLIAIGYLWILNRRSRAWMQLAFTPAQLAQLDAFDVIPIKCRSEPPALAENVVYLDAWREAAE
jgi:hypothetical protein